jgi:hypothetical protein
MGVQLQEPGPHEAIGQQARKDTWPHPEGGGQKDQGQEIWWTIARLLRQEKKILISNSEPFLF